MLISDFSREKNAHGRDTEKLSYMWEIKILYISIVDEDFLIHVIL